MSLPRPTACPDRARRSCRPGEIHARRCRSIGIQYHSFGSSLAIALALAGAPLGAQEEAARPSSNILTPNGGLMVWTLVIFGVLMFVLSKYAFRPITAAVAAREKALEDAIEQAKADRAEAGGSAAEQRQLLEQAHGDAQRLLAEARGRGGTVRQQLLEQAHAQQQEMLERARKEIDDERLRAIADLRREAVDLAIVGAGKVIEKNLDDADQPQAGRASSSRGSRRQAAR